jgi:hypothetical protein
VHLRDGKSAFELPCQSRWASVKQLSLTELMAKARQQALTACNADHQVLCLWWGIEQLFGMLQKAYKFLPARLAGKNHLDNVD